MIFIFEFFRFIVRLVSDRLGFCYCSSDVMVVIVLLEVFVFFSREG